MKKVIPRPSKDLSTPAKRLWRDLQAEYSILDAAGLDMLTDYCRFYDRREQARETIRLEGATLRDRFGQAVAHPAVRIERDSSAIMCRLIKALSLDLEPLRDGPGRPEGS